MTTETEKAMPEMVERVARALCEASGMNPNNWPHKVTAARAAIEAVKAHMSGRLSTPPGFVPAKLSGLWKRAQREYFVLSIASDPNQPDQARAARLLDRMRKAAA